MKPKNKRISIVCGLTVFVIFAGIIIWGEFLSSGWELFYSLLSFYIIMPETALIISVVMGYNKSFIYWTAPIIFFILGLIMPAIVFGGGIRFDWIILYFGPVPSLIGLLIGMGICKVRRYIKENKRGSKN